MTEMGVTRDITPYESASELRNCHAELLKNLERQLAEDGGEKKKSAALVQLEPQIRQFLQRGAATGVYLDEIKERTACQVLLDYWVSSLTRAGRQVSDALLDEFDEARLPILDDKDCPYAGLEAFREKTHFFGRESGTAELLAKVRELPLVVVVGASGSGKSSIVMAGVLPALQEKDAVHNLRILSPFTPGNSVLSKLARCVLQGDPDGGIIAEAAARLRQDPEHLHAMLGGTNAVPTLITIDQFEEVFTLCDSEDREAVSANLEKLLRADRRHRIILTLREEFRNEVVKLSLSSFLLEKAWYQMVPMGSEELKAAVEKPAAAVNLHFQTGIVEDLVNIVKGEPTALPLLQFTLKRLWSMRKRNRITWVKYNTIGQGKHLGEGKVPSKGNPLNALKEFADQFYDEDIKEDDDRNEVKRILLELVRVNELLEAYRQPVPKQTLLKPGKANTQKVLTLLAENDFIRDADEIVEVKHESLIRNWPRYVTWINEKRDNLARRLTLTRAAQQWEESGRPPEGLLTDWQVQQAMAQVDLSRLEEEFIEASNRAIEKATDKEKEQERRELEAARKLSQEAGGRLKAEERARLEAEQRAEERTHAALKLRTRLWIGVAFGVIAAIAAIAAFLSWKQASKESRIANAIRLAAQSQTTLDRYPQRSLLLAVEALATTVREGEARVPAAENALRQALSTVGGRALSGHKGFVSTLAISPDSHWLATGSEDNTARLWDLNAMDPAAASVVLRGHKDGITAVAISRDNRWLVTSSLDTTARLWDLNAKDPAAKPIILRGHEDGIITVAISPDGRWLVTGSWDKTACLWDLNAKNPAAKPIILRGHEDWITAVAISPSNHWLVTGSRDNTARLWDLNNLAAASVVLRGHENGIITMVISSDNRWLVTGSRDNTACLWDLTSKDPGASSIVLRGHKDGITTVAISPDNRWLLTGSGYKDRTARLWDLNAMDPAAASVVLRGHKDGITAVAISRDNRWLVTGSEDTTARLWDLNAKDPAAKPIILRGHEDGIITVAISPDNRWLVTGSGDKTARMWDLTAKNPATAPVILSLQETGITVVAISPDNRWLASGSDDSTARLWDLTTEDPVPAPMLLRGHEAGITAAAISPDNRWLVTGSTDKTVRLWDLTAKDPTAASVVLRGHEAGITAAAISPDNRWLVTGGWDKTARLWDLTVKDPAAASVVLRGHEKGITALAISPDSRWLVTGSSDKTARLWDLNANDLAAAPIVLRGHEDGITAVAISPSNHWLVTGSWGSTARLWDLNAKDPAAKPIVLAGHESYIMAVAISPDNRWLVTGSGDKTARLWDLNANDPAAKPIVLAGHDSYIKAVAISPDNRWLVTGSGDKTARLWDLNAKDLAAAPIVLPGHEEGITAVAISPSKHWLVTGSLDKSVRLWDLRLDEMVELACRTAGRNLTNNEEWKQYMGNQSYHNTCPGFPGMQSKKNR